MNGIELLKYLNEAKNSGKEEIQLLLRGRCGKKGYHLIYGVKGEDICDYPDGKLLCVFPVKELMLAVVKQLDLPILISDEYLANSERENS